MKEFFNALEQEGHSLYERGGKITGIQGEKRKYRFSTLGYSHERITNLNLETIEQKRRAELSLLRTKGKEQNNHRRR